MTDQEKQEFEWHKELVQTLWWQINNLESLLVDKGILTNEECVSGGFKDMARRIDQHERPQAEPPGGFV
jgi:hypothetical protein